MNRFFKISSFGITHILSLCVVFALCLAAFFYFRGASLKGNFEGFFPNGVETYNIEELQSLAAQGNSSAQRILGDRYSNGEGVPKDHSEAVKWYRMAAEQGNAIAQNNLGVIYAEGRGVPQDEFIAVSWYRKAAEQGYAPAQYNLGEMYDNPFAAMKIVEDEFGKIAEVHEVVPNDPLEAMRWFRKSAKQGYAPAQFKVGFHYRHSAAEAVSWYLKAAEQGYAPAMYYIGLMYEKGEGVPKDDAEAVKWYCMAAEGDDPYSLAYKIAVIFAEARGVSRDEVQATKWFRKAAERGDADAQYIMGSRYSIGKGVAKDESEAVKWYRMAAEQGHADALFTLGFLYANGLGVTEDKFEAVKWFRMAAEKGVIYAQCMLAMSYHYGIGASNDLAEAVKWYRKAADQGDARAQYELGRFYSDGTGVPADDAEATKWFRKSAEQNYLEAQFQLGLMYQQGRSVPKDSIEAVKWYRKAAEKGNLGGQFFLGVCYYEGNGVPKDQIEGLSWIYLSAASGDELPDKLQQVQTYYRKIAESRLGPQASLIAQKRAKELFAKIELAKQGNDSTSGDPNTQTKETKHSIPKASGSGFFVTNSGLILTAAHVVERAADIQVITHRGSKTAHLVKIDAANDMALLACEGKFQSVPMKPSSGIKLGNSVFTIGFPNISLQGFSPKMTKGEISSLSGIKDDPRHWQISVPVQPGNSGGPLFDEAGNVIGVVVAKLDAIKTAKVTGDLPQNVNYALKSIYALPLLDGYDRPEPLSTQWSSKLEEVVEKVQGAAVLILVY